LQPIRLDGKYFFKPVDFLRWLDAQSAGDWKPVQSALLALLQTVRAANADTGKPDTVEEKAPSSSVSEPAPAVVPDTEKGNGLSSSGVSEYEKCKEWLAGEMKKSPTQPPCKTITDLQKRCKTEFGIAKHPFHDAFKAAQEATGVDWYKRGRHKKSA